MAAIKRPYMRGSNIMTKQQLKQVAMIQVYLDNDMADTAARSLSGLIRAALRANDQAELYDLAQSYKLDRHPEFRI
jgi:adenylylsulfate kinase-like enzyme